MKRVFGWAIALAVAVGLVGIIHYLNPDNVDFRLTHEKTLHMPLGLLLVFALLAGVLLAVLVTALYMLARHVRGWGDRRHWRQAMKIGELHQSGADLAWGGELEQSRALLRKAWRRQPQSHSAPLALASSYMDTCEYSAAKQVLEAALERDANDPELRFMLGDVLRRNGETGEAIRMLETVRVQHPRAPRVLLSLRELYSDTGRWADAARVQEAFVHSIHDGGRGAERDRLVDLQYRAALALESAEQRIEALQAITRSERHFVPGLLSLGDTLVEAGRPDEAVKLWEKSFRGTPHVAFIERLLAHAAHARERQHALALMNKYRQQLDADDVHLVAARAAVADNQLDTAAAELQAIGRQDTAPVQRCWAELYHRRGQLEEAWNALRRVADAADRSEAAKPRA